MRKIITLGTCLLVILVSVTANAQMTYIVNANDDVNDGNCNAAHCSLREAIMAANADGVQSTIEFQIPGPNPQVINLTNTLPDFTADNTTVDGTTQSGVPGGVIIDCSGIGAVNDHVFELLGDRIRLYGMEIRNFEVQMGGNVIHVGSPGRQTQFCEIGGVDKGNIIHSITNGTAGNGNFGSAIYLRRSHVGVIQGNRIGTDYLGTQSLPVYNAGVFVEGQDGDWQLNYIGGSLPGQGNIITSCGTAGVVFLRGEGFLRNNLIGVTDRQGTNAFPNQEGVFSTSQVMIGGPGNLDGNYIGHNMTNGIRVDGLSFFQITGNRCFNHPDFGIFVGVGTGIDVNRNICYNNNYGIGISDASANINVTENELYENNIGVGSALIGGSQGHLITNNSFHCNTTTGIEIQNNGYGAFPPPVITSTSPNEIRGTSRPNADIEVFRVNNRNCPAAPCQGYSLIGSVRANAGGNWTLMGAFGGGYDATATQTDGRDNTSAFSNCVPIINDCSFVVTNVADSGPGSLREAIICANNTPGPDLIEFDVPGPGPHIISLLSPLPEITGEGTVIDGTTQPGNFPMDEQIILDGSQAGDAVGINMKANGCGLYGMVIRNFNRTGVEASGSTVWFVEDIRIGSPERGNVIINNLEGIELLCQQNCFIRSNYVGTNTSFQSGLGNSNHGINVFAGSGDNIIIGGDRSIDEGNYVSSNGYTGIRLRKYDMVTNNFVPRIYGNTVGTDPGGTMAIPNGGSEPGIWVEDLDRGSIIGGTAGRSNIVAFHEIGIGVTSDNNRITENRLYCNTVKGIELFGGSGNNDQQPPLIEIATESEISGTSKPLDFVELFVHDDTGCEGVPCQGKRFIAFAFVDNFGDWRLLPPFPFSIVNGMTVTATATDGRQNTSEYARCRVICASYKAEADHAGPFCEGDPIQLLGSSPLSGTEEIYSWTGPMGYTSTEQNPTDATVPGMYVLRVEVDGCESVRDTVIVPDFIPAARSSYMDRLCAYEMVTIGSETFDINRPNGEAVLEGASANGCDSIVTVNLSFRQGGLNETRGVLCPGQSRVINGVEYNQDNLTGADTIPGGSFNGCDSVIRVVLTLLEEPQGALTPSLCTGESVVVNGVVYDESNPQGTERLIGAAANGCDSIVQISLIFLPEPEGDLTLDICPGGSAMFNGIIYNEQNTSGQERLTGMASNGCDSLVNVQVNVLPEPTNTIQLPICPGESIFYNGTEYSEQNPSGMERLAGMGSNGCDSIVSVMVDVLEEPVGMLSFDLCPGETATFNGTVYSSQNQTGQERLTGMATSGCDSLVNVQVNVRPEPSGDLRPTVCADETFVFNGTIYDISNPIGTERLTGMAANGCDSLVQVELQFFPEARGNINRELCRGQQITINGEVFDESRASGTVTLSGMSRNGCDSIVVVQLAFVDEVTTQIDEVLCEGEQLVVNGKIYDESNPSGRELIPNGSTLGCDSVIIVNLEFRTLNAGLSPESPSCPNTRDGRILISQLGTPGESYSYSVNNGSFVQAGSVPFFIEGLAVGSQTIRFRDDAGCTFTFVVDVPTPPGLNFDLGDNKAILPGESLTLSPEVLDFSPVSISWSPARYLSCADCLSPEVTGLNETVTFTVILIDENGCEITDQITIFVDGNFQIFIPNAFSPNGDGVNDVFNVTANELISHVGRLVIFDRWGVVVYEQNNLPIGDPTIGWDGLINGKIAQPGVYAYMAEVILLNKEKRILTGDVTLLR
jgi:gliding motility-associated-like protein/CSLREA domain-containing protein